MKTNTLVSSFQANVTVLALTATLAAFAPTVASAAAFAWGQGSSGRLGNGGTTDQSKPVAVTATGALAGKTVTQVSAGISRNSCALDSDGKAYCWGSGDEGQLGNGATTDSNVPVAVSTVGALSGKTLTQISTGKRHVCAIDTAGVAYCWGSGDEGQLGNGYLDEDDNDINDDRTTPVAVSTAGVLSGKTLTQISANETHTCALDSDGKAYCWGDNFAGQLGNDNTTEQFTPVAVDTSGVLDGKTLTQISAGGVHVCALDDEGVAYCWGRGDLGQLGNGNTNEVQSTPAAVSTGGVLDGKTLSQISAGGNHTCALDDKGAAYCWGFGIFGALGNNTTTFAQSTPVAVSTSGVLSDKTLSQVSAGGDQSCAIADGKAYCWGLGEFGQLGNGASGDDVKQSTPVAVNAAGVLKGKTVSQISAGGSHTLVLAAPPVGLVSFSTDVQSVNEGEGTRTVTLNLTGLTPDKDLSVPLLISGTVGAKDYAVAKTVKIKKNTTSTDFTVTIKDDTLDEDDEEYLTLSINGDKLKAPLALGEITEQTITINDNDLPPTVSFVKETGTVTEGGKNVITLKLSAKSEKDVSIGLNTSGDAEIDDFYREPGSFLNIPAGKTSVKVTVIVPKNTDAEPGTDETVTFSLGLLGNATPGTPSTYTLTIKDKP